MSSQWAYGAHFAFMSYEEAAMREDTGGYPVLCFKLGITIPECGTRGTFIDPRGRSRNSAFLPHVQSEQGRVCQGGSGSGDEGGHVPEGMYAPSCT
jgi:hypothetical protein